ncbi:TetR/AcrR family transcriptional regulator [Amycolatopsis balhimycina DSM 5908]|uniref:TetR/AcrR family transcriptional regulator n=1 Tax=Amycolatopsis balhimycina DSM 5908 TaxID=1081091 RepID=A0A428WC53_AMYBA|nr:TetR/AcrR family transcriptional regulator [Amycolatopsis balhimycina]RSM40705.1 TetR/AcrR family transcriptional regulator [Amycolatopsis balhimycina DSM 5908]
MDNATDSGGAGYRRSAGSPRGEARRRELLAKITDDVAENGLVDFSLRRAARAAGTTHKVLLYHFEGTEDLLRQVVAALRERRVGNALAAVAGSSSTLADRVRAAWESLRDEETQLRRVLDQAMGLAMYDPGRYAALGRGASQQYLPTLVRFCPADWPERRKLEVASMILAALRGFLVSLLIDDDFATAGVEALLRAVEREEAAP